MAPEEKERNRGLYGERENEGKEKDEAYGGGCQKLTDTHSCLQLPGY